MKELSVIILNYNVRYFLELCLLSVKKALRNIDTEIIVVDNASVDDSSEMVLLKFPEVIFIQNAHNEGFPKGNNIGFKKATGKYICILNPDTVVAEDTFKVLLEFAANQKTFGALGCKLIDGGGSFLPESKRGIPTPWVAFTKVVGLYKLFPKNKLFNQYYAQHIAENETKQTDILVGAFIVTTQHVYNTLNGFDENCFMYADDIDFCYRVQQLGLSVFYVPKTTVIHFKGESTLKNKTYQYRFQEAMQYFYKKHFKKSYFFDYSIRIASFLFSVFKQQQKATKVTPNHHVIISQKTETIQKISSKLSKKYSIWKNLPENSVISQTITANPNIEFIFDTETLTFKECIEFMNLYQKVATFKFAVSNSSYLIGSQSSIDKGEIILL